MGFAAVSYAIACPIGPVVAGLVQVSKGLGARRLVLRMWATRARARCAIKRMGASVGFMMVELLGFSSSLLAQEPSDGLCGPWAVRNCLVQSGKDVRWDEVLAHCPTANPSLLDIKKCLSYFGIPSQGVKTSSHGVALHRFLTVVRLDGDHFVVVIPQNGRTFRVLDGLSEYAMLEPELNVRWDGYALLVEPDAPTGRTSGGLVKRHVLAVGVFAVGMILIAVEMLRFYRNRSSLGSNSEAKAGNAKDL